MHRLVEIVEGGGRDAVVAEAEIDLVEIELEDLLLRIGGLDAEGDQRLAYLALERALVADEEVLGDLLRDGGCALHMLGALQQDHHGARDAFRIDAVMRVEILVLGRDEGMLHQRRNRIARQIEPALARIFGQNRAVARVDAGHDRRLVVLELRGVGQILRIGVDHRSDRHGADHEKDRAGRKYEAEKAADHPHIDRLCSMVTDQTPRFSRRPGVEDVCTPVIHGRLPTGPRHPRTRRCAPAAHPYTQRADQSTRKRERLMRTICGGFRAQRATRRAAAPI